MKYHIGICCRQNNYLKVCMYKEGYGEVER